MNPKPETSNSKQIIMKELITSLKGDKVIWAFVALLAMFSFMPVHLSAFDNSLVLLTWLQFWAQLMISLLSPQLNGSPDHSCFMGSPNHKGCRCQISPMNQGFFGPQYWLLLRQLSQSWTFPITNAR